MTLSVTEANAVFDLLHWLGHHPLSDHLVDDERAAIALGVLAKQAGRRLQITVRPDEARQALARLAGRLAAADSDGAAQQVCEGLATHLSHGGSIPWPAIRRPYDEWVAARAAQQPPARPEIEGQLSITGDHP